jgi:hypothetical protein
MGWALCPYELLTKLVIDGRSPLNVDSLHVQLVCES